MCDALLGLRYVVILPSMAHNINEEALAKKREALSKIRNLDALKRESAYINAYQYSQPSSVKTQNDSMGSSLKKVYNYRVLGLVEASKNQQGNC